MLNEKPKAIINCVDATNIERNLYLTMQLLELDIPTVVALNIMDELTANGGSVDINTLEELLGVPVVPISAAKNQGVDELVKHAIHIAYYQEKPQRQDFCLPDEKGGAVHRCLHAVRHLIEDKALEAGIPLHFAASKVVEGDERILEALKLESSEQEMLEHIIKQMEKERGLDRNAAIADMRFSFIKKVCAHTVTKPRESREHRRSTKIDSVLTGRFTAIPFFILIMAAIFWLTFDVIGGNLQSLMQTGLDNLSGVIQNGLESAEVNPILTGLLTEGILAGLGSVLSFLPIIVVLFLFLSILEDSGYLARVAFFMDKLLRKIGLSGRSIVPMLIGFGCTVPAVMSTRTLPSERDRKMTILLTPFMSCSAKLPIYAFFATAFFPGKSWLVITLLYLLGIVIGILDDFQGRGGSVCYGAAQLPPARSQERYPSSLGKGKGLFAARLYGNIHLDYYRLVFAELQLSIQHGRQFAGQHFGSACRLYRSRFCACRNGRLEDNHRADQRLYGKGKRCVEHGDTLHRRNNGRCFLGNRNFHPRFQPALYTVRRGDSYGKARAWNPLGCRRYSLAVCNSLRCRRYCDLHLHAVRRLGGRYEPC